jgi:hypothetical protein
MKRQEKGIDMQALDPKVVAAISGAVGAYLEEEAAAKIKADVSVAVPYKPLNIWAISGRQDAMFQRRLWQMRMY